MSKKVVFIDGNSLLYRAFYALPLTLKLPSGQVTNAVYGFTSMLLRLLIDEKPQAVGVAFDSRGPTLRHGHYEGYKAQRQPMPDELASQIPLVYEVLDALNIPIFALPGYEADDILATLTERARQLSYEVKVVTGDRDAFQLICDQQVEVLTTRKGITDIVYYNREKVKERYGIQPEQVPDFLALKGDPSDNIPGVPGIGDKTASALIQQFGSVNFLYQHLDEVQPEKIRQKLKDYQEQAFLSYQLAVLNKETPITVDFHKLTLGLWDEEKVRDVFTRLAFRSLLERFEQKLADLGERKLPLFQVFVTKLPWLEFIKQVQMLEVTKVGFDFIYNENGQAVGVVVAYQKDKQNQVLATLFTNEKENIKEIFNWLASKNVAALNLKNKIKLGLSFNLLFQGQNMFDPLLIAYLLAPHVLTYELSHLAHRYLNSRLQEGLSGAEAAAQRAAVALVLSKPMFLELQEHNLQSVYHQIELPLSYVLARMELNGVKIKKKKLVELATKLQKELDALSQQIFALCQEKFNLNSPQQLAKVLFTKLKLKPVKKTKITAAYATDIAVLTKLIDKHPVIPLLIKYRELAKLKSTYVDALLKLINPKTGKLHTTFNQTVTATGRLSSSNPNLQNIPVRTSLGQEIRAAFIPTQPEEKLLVADYSQIELRLMAHLSGDKNLRRAFLADEDIHAATAGEVFNLKPGEITSAWRRRAKAINFGIIYGISAYGLSEQLQISPEEAKAYIESYFNRYPQVNEFIQKTIAEAHKNGFITTMFGRKRPLPELQSSNYNERMFGERAAVNGVLQGTAADIIKMAMINIDRFLLNEGLLSKLILQVHDELVLEVAPLEQDYVGQKVKELMEHVCQLQVPLKVDLSFKDNWGNSFTN